MRALKTVIVAGSMLALAAAGAEAQQPASPRPRPERQAQPVDVRAIVAEIRRIIADRYVLPERRPALDAALAQALAAGRYDTREPTLLAERINEDLERVGHDRHLNFTFDPDRAAMLSAPRPEQGESGAYERQVRAGNHGIRELRVLPGNVRYMDYTDFDFIGEESEAALANAMRFLAGGEAIIIDLRRNRGGHHPSVRYLISHFLEAGRPLATFMRNGQVEGRSEAFADLPAGRMIGKPLYVLTGSGTGSAAEEFVGHVAGYRLGDIVGEATGGAAYRNELVPMPGGFVFSVSTGRTVLAATGGDWEGVGVAPTIRAPIRNALYVAHASALRRRAAQAEGPERARLEGTADAIMARAEQRTPALPLSAYAGRYGDWTVSEEHGRLHIRRGNLEPLTLVPLGGNRFTYEDQPSGVTTFLVNGTNVSALELGLVAGPRMGRFERTQ